jgi:DnaJ-domain-containing protein 1
MILASRLALTTLGDLLGALYRAEARGTLELTEAVGRVHRLHFNAGRVHYIESPLGAGQLGELLVSKGLLSRLRQLELLSYLEDQPGKSTGQWLTELNWVPLSALCETAREQVTSRLSALYQLSDARVTYRIARPTPTWLLSTTPLTAEEFLHGRPRTRDRKPTPSASNQPNDPPGTCLYPVDSQRRRALLLLGLDSHSDKTDVKRAFRRIAAKLHPDRHLVAPAEHQELVRRRFSQVTEAYHLLTG